MSGDHHAPVLREAHAMRRLLHPAPAGLGEAHGVQAAGNDEPIPSNRVGDAGRIGLDRTQVTEGLHLPSWESRLARRSHQLVAACALRRRDAGIRLMQKCNGAPNAWVRSASFASELKRG
jgi:hypothetical protein